ncbi:60S ribosomal protein L36, partial [Sigmodon hispidus]
YHRRETAMVLCYPMAVSLNKAHKVTKNVSKPRHSSTAGTSSSTPSSCQVHVGHDQGGVWVCALRAMRHVAAQGIQGQVCTQVHQEEGGHAHLRQEEA